VLRYFIYTLELAWDHCAYLECTCRISRNKLSRSGVDRRVVVDGWWCSSGCAAISNLACCSRTRKYVKEMDSTDDKEIQ
jgi:hypothetical protein